LTREILARSASRVLKQGVDGAARLWAISSDKLLHEWRDIESEGPIYTAVFSQDEKCLLTWSSAGRASYWFVDLVYPDSEPYWEWGHDGLNGAAFSEFTNEVLAWDW